METFLAPAVMTTAPDASLVALLGQGLAGFAAAFSRMQEEVAAARPASFRPGDPCPDLLTEDEAVRYLRLDTIDIKNPGETLERYRKNGLLRGTQVSKRVFYLRRELDAFLDRQTQAVSR